MRRYMSISYSLWFDGFMRSGVLKKYAQTWCKFELNFGWNGHNVISQVWP